MENLAVNSRSPERWICTIQTGTREPAGVGFIVAESHVLTCAHVVNAALRRDERDQRQPSQYDLVHLEFSLLGGTPPRRARVAKWLPPPPEASEPVEGPSDIALLEVIEPLPAGSSAAPLGSAIEHARVEVFGYPANPRRADGCWATGELLRRVRSGLIQIDGSLTAAVKAQPGYSGSPVIDTDRGRVVGMLATASILNDQRDSYAIPEEWLRGVWPEPPKPPPSRAWWSLMVQAVAGRARHTADWSADVAGMAIVQPVQRRPKRAIAIGVGVIVLVAAAAVAGPKIFSAPAAACRPPLELRVLSSPEQFRAIAAAAMDFAHGERDAQGCRRVHLTVYQASTNAVLRAFAQADGWARPAAQPATSGNSRLSCPGVSDASPGPAAPPSDPGRDIGPRPDIWFPDSTVDVDRARCVAPEAVQFGESTSVAWSPLVLGVPRASRESFPPAQPQDWAILRKGVDDIGLDLVRPNPEVSTTGLLHTAGLYGALGSRAIPDLENSLVTGSLPLSDSVDLLCHLATVGHAPPGPAVLVSEAAMVNYNVQLSALPNCSAESSVLKFDALYPSAPNDPSRIAALNHPFVDLTWASEKTNADHNPARAAAVQSFRNWLLSEAGQRKLSTFSLRPVRDVSLDPNSPLTHRLSGAQPQPPGQAPLPTGDEVSNTIKAYVAAREAGRVVFLVDVSWSMIANGNLAAAKGIVESALGLMREQDEAGLTTVPKSTGDSGALNVLVPLGTQSSAAVREALGGVVPVRNGAALYDAIDRQLALMAASRGPAKQTLVVITDGEDVDNGMPLSGQTVDSLLARHGGRSVTVQVVALPPASCGQDLNRLADGLGGRCASIVDNRTGASLVAGVW